MIEGVLKGCLRGRGLQLYSKEKQRFFDFAPDSKVVVLINNEWTRVDVHIGQQGSVCNLIVGGHRIQENLESKIVGGHRIEEGLQAKILD